MSESNKKSKKITIRVSSRLRGEVQSAVNKAGFGSRGKSKWLKQAIANFLKDPNFVDYVEHGTDINQAELNQVEAFYIDQETILKLKEAVLTVRVKYPMFEGVQSALIRAAIVYSLMLK